MGFHGGDVAAFSDSGETVAEMAYAGEDQFLARKIGLSVEDQSVVGGMNGVLWERIAHLCLSYLVW